MVMVGAQRCGPSNERQLRLDCVVPRGADEAMVFSNKEEFGSFDGVASFKLR
jgi:hypothetical protein